MATSRSEFLETDTTSPMILVDMPVKRVLAKGLGPFVYGINPSPSNIAGENAIGRTTIGYVYKSSKDEDTATMSSFNKQIEAADKSKTTIDKRGFKQHILKDDYHAVNKNCTTVCIGGVQAGKSDLAKKLADPKESKGRGLNWMEKQLAGEVGNKIFMPEDLKANVESSGGFYKHNEYKAGKESN